MVEAVVAMLKLSNGEGGCREAVVALWKQQLRGIGCVGRGVAVLGSVVASGSVGLVRSQC